MTDSRDYPGLLARFRSKRILVVGDLMLDEFVRGRVNRISPEAPVPIVEVSEHSYYPGGAANVARNLREFSDSVTIMGIAGNDPHAEILKGLLLAQDIRLAGFQQHEAYQTIVKTRIIARQQHVVRVDRESPTAPPPDCPPQGRGGVEGQQPARAARRTLLGVRVPRERPTPPRPVCPGMALAVFESLLPDLDAVIIEDYAKGFLTQPFVDRIGALARAQGKLVTVDPNPRNALRWNGVTAIKPNRVEAFHVAGMPPVEVTEPVEDDPALRRAGERLLELWDTEMVLITLGEQGMMLFRRGHPAYPVPPCRREVFDLSGAGDTSIALFTLALAAGTSPEEATNIANHAGSVVVGKLGIATLNADELLASLQSRR